MVKAVIEINGHSVKFKMIEKIFWNASLYKENLKISQNLTMFLATEGGFDDEARNESMESVTTGDNGLSSSAVIRRRA